MKFVTVLTAALCLTLAAGAQTSSAGSDGLPWQTGDAQTSKSASKASDSVQFLDPVRVSVPSGKLTVVPLHFVIANGLHINSHTPHDANLIPTRIAVVDGDGLRTKIVDFPPGTDSTFAFAPDEKLSIYSGDLVLKAHIIAFRGTHQWQGVLRYQACNMDECLPPRKLPVTVDIVAN